MVYHQFGPRTRRPDPHPVGAPVDNQCVPVEVHVKARLAEVKIIVQADGVGKLFPVNPVVGHLDVVGVDGDRRPRPHVEGGSSSPGQAVARHRRAQLVEAHTPVGESDVIGIDCDPHPRSHRQRHSTSSGQTGTGRGGREGSIVHILLVRQLIVGDRRIARRDGKRGKGLHPPDRLIAGRLDEIRGGETVQFSGVDGVSRGDYLPGGSKLLGAVDPVIEPDLEIEVVPVGKNRRGDIGHTGKRCTAQDHVKGPPVAVQEQGGGGFSAPDRRSVIRPVRGVSGLIRDHEFKIARPLDPASRRSHLPLVADLGYRVGEGGNEE